MYFQDIPDASYESYKMKAIWSVPLITLKIHILPTKVLVICMYTCLYLLFIFSNPAVEFYSDGWKIMKTDSLTTITHFTDHIHIIHFLDLYIRIRIYSKTNHFLYKLSQMTYSWHNNRLFLPHKFWIASCRLVDVLHT